MTWPWLASYILVSLGLWLSLWRLEAGFWWVIWVQVAQMYLFLPLKAALLVTTLIFLGVAHFDNGLWRFLNLPLNQAIEKIIPWAMFSLSFSFISLLVKANQERARLIAELQTARQELELAHRQEVELATLRERERLARDMHDSLGHALVALSVQLEAVQRLYPHHPERASGQIDEMKKLTRTSMESLRRTLAGLRAPGLGDRPLAQSLRKLSQETAQRAGLEITCQVAPEVDRLNPVVAEALWRVVQEALLNIEKHAVAQHVQIDLQMKPEAVILQMADDGIGLSANPTSQPGHYGLQGMRERIEGLGGILTLSGSGQTGTVIEANLPLIGYKKDSVSG